MAPGNMRGVPIQGRRAITVLSICLELWKLNVLCLIHSGGVQ
jgi:hypothetical protein